MHRTIATHLAVMAVGMGAGIGAVAVANQPQAHTASDAQIIRELRAIQKKQDLTNKNLSGGLTTITPLSTVHDLLKDICRNTRGDNFASC